MTDQIFDAAAWGVICKQCAAAALQGAGQSETVFAQNLHREIHGRLHEIASEHRARALEMAHDFGYLDDAELEADAQWNAENGYCSHGIALGHCPAGCEDDDTDEPDHFDASEPLDEI